MMNKEILQLHSVLDMGCRFGFRAMQHSDRRAELYEVLGLLSYHRMHVRKVLKSLHALREAIDEYSEGSWDDPDYLRLAALGAPIERRDIYGYLQDLLDTELTPLGDDFLSAYESARVLTNAVQESCLDESGYVLDLDDHQLRKYSGAEYREGFAERELRHVSSQWIVDRYAELLGRLRATIAERGDLSYISDSM